MAGEAEVRRENPKLGLGRIKFHRNNFEGRTQFMEQKLSNNERGRVAVMPAWNGATAMQIAIQI
jgi:hypothetical protein